MRHDRQSLWQFADISSLTAKKVLEPRVGTPSHVLSNFFCRGRKVWEKHHNQWFFLLLRALSLTSETILGVVYTFVYDKLHISIEM